MSKISLNPFSRNLVHAFSNALNRANKQLAKTVSVIAAVAAFNMPSLWAAAPKSLAEKKVVRAAFDLGSGAFKLCVTEASNGNLKVLFQKVIAVNLGADCNANQGMLSEVVQTKALEALKNLHSDAKKEEATSFRGIATAVFRKASNGKDLLKRLQDESQIPLQIITQEEEGRLGFLTGAAIFPQIPKDELLLLDIGSSSVQITGKDNIYGADIGYSKIAQIFAEQVRKQTYSPNMMFDSITDEEILELSELIISQLPNSDWQTQRIASGKASFSYFDYTKIIDTIEQLTSKRDTLRIEELLSGIKRLNDPSFELKNVSMDQRQYRTFCLTLLYSLMKKFGYEKINLGINDVGNAPGLVLDEAFWH